MCERLNSERHSRKPEPDIPRLRRQCMGHHSAGDGGVVILRTVQRVTCHRSCSRQTHCMTSSADIPQVLTAAQLSVPAANSIDIFDDLTHITSLMSMAEATPA